MHIIDNHDPRHPERRAFIQIPGNVDIAIKENILYADNVTDLLVIDISDLNDIRLTKRIENAFPNKQFPPVINTHFECVDASRGVVTGWEWTELENPKCQR
ncbi:MAG: hypothetical protein HC880_20140 [Bacteroidia bacterium]|nr:hypothetical protein [Bacteroidia bacterium]